MKNPIGNERYRHYTTPQLLNAYRQGPGRISHVIKDLTLEDLKSKLIPGKWSILEIVIHLTDAELIGACRFRLVISHYTGTLPFYNQDDLAVKLKYNEQSEKELSENLSLFGSIRETTHSILLQCSDNDWHKTGIHPARGEMSLRALLELYADHAERHIEQILRLRQLLKKPMEFELLLKDRLY